MTFRILLVEDEPTDARLIGQALTDIAERGALSMDVEVAGELAHACDHLRASPWDLILLDLHLPDSRGLDTLVGARDATDAPIVVISALADEELTLSSLHHGADDYVVKGAFGPASLLRTMAFAVARHAGSPGLLEQMASAQRLLARAKTAVKGAGETVAARETVDEVLRRTLGDLLEVAVTKRAFGAGHAPESLISEIVPRLATLDITPTELIGRYSDVIKEKLAFAAPHRRAEYVEEGRIILISLLGRMAQLYREQAAV